MPTIMPPTEGAQVPAAQSGWTCPNCGETATVASEHPYYLTVVKVSFACPNRHIWILEWDRGAA